jgi:L-gulonolactone oxidase
MLLASGEIQIYSQKKNPDLFPAVLCSLGCLGIILTATIQCEKAFRLEQIEYPAKLDDVKD